ncbi:glycosyl transferase group 1 [Arthrobacter livingstonensis]|uniref:Glycosyl transferase group 1 n=1 Tax=Arthrobacter livingstonensis TaxID=670078 RepID=A0A2V5L9K2_9MICC|nr:glycosyltransferase family 1 protein [Arthrobacter livingstonensis]PYI68361.1 glycosyl transferase group 1 [Arthrobacter livingstonensis]
MAKQSLGRLVDQLRLHGTGSVARRVCKRSIERLADRLQLGELDFPLRDGDVADSGMMAFPDLGAKEAGGGAGGKLNIGWVCAPPQQGSGGHTTLFRMIAAMMEQGHHCTILLYDKNSDDVSHHEGVIRNGWPWLGADVLSATAPTGFLDVVIASSWQSAHVVASRMSAVPHKFYFIQDFEPYFYPRGALYALAEDTYRFGFKNIALGDMVAGSIRSECGAPIHATVPFGCDNHIYHATPRPANGGARNGVVFYAKKSADRRGYLLGKKALEIFGRNNPGQVIHVYGDNVAGWDVPVVSHGNLPPGELNDLYNTTVASLVMSFTNISLVAGELISAGNIPVMNDSALARLDLDSPHAVWATATPYHLASALEAAIAYPDIAARAKAAAASVQISWQESSELLCRVIEDSCSMEDPPTVGGRVGQP